MSLRLPLYNALSYSQTVENGAGVDGSNASVNGGVAKPFMLPQDTDNVVVKLTASIKGGGVSAVFQTSDDGGTTYYDVARTSIVSNTPAGFAEWLSIPVIGMGVRTGVIVPSVVADGSVYSFGSVFSATGRSAPSTLGQKEVSGLPILGQQNRVFLRYTTAITSIISEAVTVSCNNQSATA